MLKAGDSVPSMPIPSTEGGDVDVSRLSRTILYFYPKDESVGCTKEACSMRDVHADIKAAGWQVYGASPDSIASHKGFAEHHGFSFPLLSDEDHALAEAFGVWGEKQFAGKSYVGVLRTTFAIDGGQILQVWEDVTPEGHGDEILEWIRGEERFEREPGAS